MFRVVSRSGNERLFRQLGICLLSIRVQSLVPVLRSSKKKKKKEKWMELYEDEKHLSIKNVGGVFLFFPLFANDERFYYVSRA